MNEQLPSMHEIVNQDIAEITGKVHISKTPEFSDSTQVADINGQRLAVDTSQNLGGFEKERTSVVASNNPIQELGTLPERISGNEVDLGLRHSKAEISRTVQHDDSVASRAVVKTEQGLYIARESRDGRTDTHVERPGYGTVEIKNPRARDLVAKLAGKAIKNTQEDIQEVKGKELVQDRDWLKKTRRTIRKVTGQKIQEAA